VNALKLNADHDVLVCLLCDQVAERQQQDGGRGSGRGGAELLARPRPGQERVDAGDGHPVAVLDVAPRSRINDAGCT
jgi:hypothetical protein